MKARALKIIALSILWVLGLSVLVAAGFYWRLSQGPISLAFLGDRIENAINAQLSGMKITLGKTELELDAVTRAPHVRARNLVLRQDDGQVIASAPKAGVALDTGNLLRGVISVTALELIGPRISAKRNLVLRQDDGQVIASAPKAGVALDTGNLLRGVISVTALELIGPRISAKRNLDGSLVLGIEADAASPEQEIFVDASEIGAAEPEPLPSRPAPAGPEGSLLSGKRLLDLLDAGGEDGTLSRLEELRISRGVLRFYDEANDATWVAPQADLAFRRTEGGFVVAGKTSVNSGGAPWKLEASATYRRAANNYTANIAITDLVPAQVADEIFALSQFARVNMPFSGHLELEAKEGGVVTSASGQFFAGKGRIDLPDYIARPIEIEEASFRVSYGGAGKPLEITESSILMLGSRAELQGKFLPQYDSEGRLRSIGFDLKSDNASVNTDSPDPIFVDHVEFRGIAAVEEQRIDIDDLIVMSSNTGIRMRGIITAGEQSPGINVAGRMRDVSAGLLKKLWPPVLAPRTRGWINDNIEDGRISEGTFQVNFAPDVLAEAQARKKLPDNVVDLRLKLDGVRSRYFKSLPVLREASGNAHLKDGDFNLSIDDGHVELASGTRVELASGRFNATDLLAQAVPGKFLFDVRGSIPALLEFASHPDLNISGANPDLLPKLSGKAQALVGLELPLIKNVPRSSVKVTTDVKVTDVAVAGIMPNVDLSDGNFDVLIKPETVVVKGPAKLNGVGSSILWEKPRKGGAASVVIETVADAKLRARLGINLDDFMSGDVPVQAVIVPGDDGKRTIDVKADLSEVSMKIAAAGWKRGAVPGTRATFRIVDAGNGARTIEDLTILGKGLRVRGRVSLKPGGGFKVIDLEEISLGEDDVFRAKLQPGDDGMHLDLVGNVFDARPYIKNLISPAKPSGSQQSDGGGVRYVVNATFSTVTAHRGEDIKNVKASLVARGNQITTANIEGKFLSGLPVSVTLTPVPGGRELRVTSADGGSALRASNFYSKVAGGELQFYALISNAQGSPIRKGELTLRRFDVRNEAALAELDSRGRPKKSGPRREGISFKRLTLPFSTDEKYVRMCDIELKGNELGAVAGGLIRKSDGAIDITGTMIPAQGINGFLDDVPLLGPLLTGGDNEGIFGVTFAMGGTISKPQTQANPASVLLPGFLRKMSEFRSACSRGGAVRPPRDP